MANPKYMAYGGRGYDTKEQFYNAGEGLKVKHTPISRTEQFKQSTEAGRAGLYVDSPFDLASANDNAYRDGVDRTIEVIEPLLVERDELLEACKLMCKYWEHSNSHDANLIRNVVAKAEGRA